MKKSLSLPFVFILAFDGSYLLCSLCCARSFLGGFLSKSLAWFSFPCFYRFRGYGFSSLVSLGNLSVIFPRIFSLASILVFFEFFFRGIGRLVRLLASLPFPFFRFLGVREVYLQVSLLFCFLVLSAFVSLTGFLLFEFFISQNVRVL